MKLRVLAIQARIIPPIEEFLLKLMLEGIETESLMAGLLGLDSDLVRDRLVKLRVAELVDVTNTATAAGDGRCVLTERGREVARSLRQDAMQEITVPDVIYHGLLRRPIQYGAVARRQFLRPKDASAAGLTLVRAIPSRPPHVEEIDVSTLDRIVKRDMRGKSRGEQREVVAVKGVLPKVYTLYEPGVMLEYETVDNRRTRQVAFAIEGQLLDEYETAFAQLRGPELLADLMTPHTDPLPDRVSRLAPRRIVEKLGRLDDVEALATTVAAASQKLRDVEHKREELQQQVSETDRADTREVLRRQLTKLEQELEDAKKSLGEARQARNARKVKHIWTPEIRDKFWKALEIAQDRLLILSGFINSEVVDQRFVSAMKQALERGVRVWIGYGFDKGKRRGERQRQEPSWKEAEASLGQLQKAFPDRFVYRDVGRSHEKRVICDDKFTFGGSFNLLSFSGERRGNESLRHEGADLIEGLPEYCEELYAKYMRLFFASK